MCWVSNPAHTSFCRLSSNIIWGCMCVFLLGGWGDLHIVFILKIIFNQFNSNRAAFCPLFSVLNSGQNAFNFKVQLQDYLRPSVSSVAAAITVVIALLPFTREVVKAYPLLKAKAKSRWPSAQSVADSIFSARRGLPPEATEAQKLLSFKKHLVAPSSASV